MIRTELTIQEKSDLLELITFLSTLSNTSVSIENGEFTISYPGYHTHVRIDFAPLHDLSSAYDILFAIDKFNKENHIKESYENLRSKGIDPKKWFREQRGNEFGVSLSSQSRIDEYNEKLKNFKNKYEELKKELRRSYKERSKNGNT